VAAWLGPTKLAVAILYATITNIVAYLPFLLISGDTGMFIRACRSSSAPSLLASRIVSMTSSAARPTTLEAEAEEVARGDSEHSSDERRKSDSALVLQGGPLGDRAPQGRASRLVARPGRGRPVAKTLKQQFFPKDYS